MDAFGKGPSRPNEDIKNEETEVKNVRKSEQCKYNIKDAKYLTDKISVIYTNADCLTNKNLNSYYY